MEDNYEEVIYVITRTGKKEALSPDKITTRLQSLIARPPKIQHVNAYQLMLTVTGSIKNLITTYEIDEFIGNTAASLSITMPHYMKLASRIIVDNHQRYTDRSFIDKMGKAYRRVVNGQIVPLLSEEFYKYVESNQDFIERTIDYSRDFLIDFFGFKTFLKLYSIKIDDKPIERPQDMFMRCAIAIHMNTVAVDNKEPALIKELALIKETYDVLSAKYMTHASPTLFNAGMVSPQYASCFLLGTDDSREGIMQTADHMSQISKWGGGIGLSFDTIRSKNAVIRGTNGLSSGIVPFLRIYDATMQAFNQGGKRYGSAAIYLSPHHSDIMEFLALKLHNGREEERARSLFYAMWIPNLFMERLRTKKSVWSLFNTDTVGNLTELYDEKDDLAYTKRYLELEEKKLYIKQIPTTEIWEAIYNSVKQTGIPYLCFSDNANQMSMQKNIGTIHCSNLCSEIFLHSSNTEYAVCNLVSINLQSCVVESVVESNTADKVESNTGSNAADNVESNTGSNAADNVESNAGNVESNAGNADKVESATKHNIAGNDSISVNIVEDVEFPINPIFDFRKLIKLTKIAVQNLNNVIDKTYYPTEETRRSNLRHRPIGIGVQGLADAYLKMHYSYDSDEAKALNKQISECMYYAALSQSAEIARQRYLQLKKIAARDGSVTVKEYHLEDYADHCKTYTLDTLPTTIGSYPSMLWNGGSPISKGIFHWELYGLTEKDLSKTANLSQAINQAQPTDQAYLTRQDNQNILDEIKPPTHIKHSKKDASVSSGALNVQSIRSKQKPHYSAEQSNQPNQPQPNQNNLFDWESLREKIRMFGVYNSQLLALMPTASTSQLLGNNECFDPYVSNLFTRKTLAGEFILINKFLVNDIYRLGLWSERFHKYLEGLEGSIQNIDGIPDEIKAKYKTAYEINPSVLVQHAIDRQPFIDQGQSLNWYISNVTLKQFNELAFQAWRGKLKTGKYYLHSAPAVNAVRFSLNPKDAEEMKKLLAQEKKRVVNRTTIETICESCSS